MTMIKGRLNLAPPVGGGEGPWLMSLHGAVTIDGVQGDKWVLWADNVTPPTLPEGVVYQGNVPYPYGYHVWIVCFVADVSGAYIYRDSCAFWEFLMHKVSGLLYLGNLDTLSMYCD